MPCQIFDMNVCDVRHECAFEKNATLYVYVRKQKMAQLT